MTNTSDHSTLVAHQPGPASQHAVWIEPPVAPVTGEWSGSPLIDTILYARGIRSHDEANAFLSPRSGMLGDPFLLPDMDRAVALVERARESGDRVAIFGDYDVDGLTSTAMLVRVLRRLGIDPIPIIPHRMNDGYGVNPMSMRHIVSCNPGLVISVDCGSSSSAEFQQLIDSGMSAIVLDHHAYAGALPPDVAFVSPRRPDNTYPCTDLAAVGVAFTFVRALLGDDAASMYLPYVAIGSIADVVPLLGENRTLVANGIAKLRRWSLPGFNALCAAAGIERQQVRAWDIGYLIGPRLNAAGRIDSPQVALDLLLADDEPSAIGFALRLGALNERRQAETQRIQAEAEEMLAATGGAANQPAIVLANEGWSVGVAGLVASRLAETYARPTVILERGSDVSRGSARTAGNINIVEAIGASAELLERFGGHAAAAGLTLPNEHVDRFRDELRATVFDLAGGMLPTPVYNVDAEVDAADLSLDTVDLLEWLEPFGAGNPQPLLLVRNLRHRYVKTSRDGRHLMFHAQGRRGRSQPAIQFGAGHRLHELVSANAVDVLCRISRDTWGDRVRLRLLVSDFRVSLP